jgi:hypothetical protein
MNIYEHGPIIVPSAALGDNRIGMVQGLADFGRAGITGRKASCGHEDEVRGRNRKSQTGDLGDMV